MINLEKVISQLETDYRDAEHRGWILVPVSRRTVKDALSLLKEQENASKRHPVIICPHCGRRLDRNG